MRKVDESKKELIKQVVFQIVFDEGLSALSFSKIAKRAGVSSGTPYVYFADKTDMLSQLYIEVKQLMDSELKADIDAGGTYEEKLYNAVDHFATRFVQHPLEARYSQAIQTSPELVSPDAINQGVFLTQPLQELLEEGRDAGAFKDDNLDHVTATLFAPWSWLIDQQQTHHKPVELAGLRQLIRIGLRGILK